ncbi:MAG: hypothetical protein AAGA48_17255 [Myxococcota bacterium]
MGFESANDVITDGLDLPWLQNTETADVWNIWSIAYRDVVVLDEAGAIKGVVNVTTHDLGIEANREALRTLLMP